MSTDNVPKIRPPATADPWAEAAVVDAARALVRELYRTVGRLDGHPIARHYETAGWSDPDGCGIECACGVTFGGFDTIAEAAKHLAAHIANPDPAPALDPDRQALVDGLRELADWYAANPDVPMPIGPKWLDYPDDEATVARIAGVLGVDVTTTPAGHIAAEHRFGPIGYRAVFVPPASMARHHAESAAIRELKAAGWKPGDPVPMPAADPTGLGHSREVDDEVGAVPLPAGVVDPLHAPDVEHRYEVGDLVHVLHWPGLYRVTAPAVVEDDGIEMVSIESTTDPTQATQAPPAVLSLATGRPVSGPPAAPEELADDAEARRTGGTFVGRYLATGHDAGDHSRCCDCICDGTPPADVPATAPVLTLDHPPRQPAGYDPQPTLIWNGTRVGLAEAYADYARTLDRECPGWWRDDTTGMSAGLAALALERRGAEGGDDRG